MCYCLYPIIHNFIKGHEPNLSATLFAYIILNVLAAAVKLIISADNQLILDQPANTYEAFKLNWIIGYRYY